MVNHAKTLVLIILQIPDNLLTKDRKEIRAAD